MSSIPSQEKTISIDEHGKIFLGEEPLKSSEDIKDIFLNLRLTSDFNYETQFNDQSCVVEVFDAAVVAQSSTKMNDRIVLSTVYGLKFAVLLETLRVDEWDRFYGLCQILDETSLGEFKLPFVMTEKAQSEFFDLLDSFDDESFIFLNKQYQTHPIYEDNIQVKDQNFWNEQYKKMQKPGWDLQQPSPIFLDMLPRLKLHKSKIIVLGCGEGHDAALFAENGHVVTAVDFSEAALAKARLRYSHLNINWLNQDVFQLSHDYDHQFDLVVEHTCFCAVTPDRRQELVDIWSRLLHSQGQLMSIFFVMPKYFGPPYGATEWEIRKRLNKKFQFLFWNRSQLSVPSRLGKELFVLAQKRGQQ